MKDLSGYIKKRRCDRLDEWSMDSLANAADELECCIEGKDKEILELDIKLNNSIPISKIQELIISFEYVLGCGASIGLSDVIGDIRKLIDDNNG